MRGTVSTASVWFIVGALQQAGADAGALTRRGKLGLYDYLFAPAATLGEALAVGARFISILNRC